MTTDPTPLQERIARAIHRSDEDEMDRLSDDFGDLAPHWQRMYLMNAAAVLPIIAAEVQAAEHRATRAEARLQAVRDALDADEQATKRMGPLGRWQPDTPAIASETIRRALDGDA